MALYKNCVKTAQVNRYFKMLIQTSQCKHCPNAIYWRVKSQRFLCFFMNNTEEVRIGIRGDDTSRAVTTR